MSKKMTMGSGALLCLAVLLLLTSCGLFTDDDARVALQQLYQSSGKWNALSESIRGEIDTLGPEATEEKLRLLRDLIPIYRDALELDSMLIQVYGEILALAPNDREALSSVAALYEEAGRWNELIHVLERQAELAEEPEDEVALYWRTANLWMERFGNMNQATVPLERIVALQPDHLEALAAAARAHEAQGVRHLIPGDVALLLLGQAVAVLGPVEVSPPASIDLHFAVAKEIKARPEPRSQFVPEAELEGIFRS